MGMGMGMGMNQNKATTNFNDPFMLGPSLMTPAKAQSNYSLPQDMRPATNNANINTNTNTNATPSANMFAGLGNPFSTDNPFGL